MVTRISPGRVREVAVHAARPHGRLLNLTQPSQWREMSGVSASRCGADHTPHSQIEISFSSEMESEIERQLGAP